MELLTAHMHHVASLHHALFATQHHAACAVDDGPHLFALVVHLIAVVFACLDAELLGEHFLTVGKLDMVNHLVFAPAALLVHWACVGTELRKVGFELFGVGFVSHQNAVAACCHHQVVGAEANQRHAELVHHMGVFCLRVEHHFANGLIGQLFGEGIPCAEVFPLASEWNHCHRFGTLCHFVVEADFWELLIA